MSVEENILNNIPKLTKDITEIQMCISSRLDDILKISDIKHHEISGVLNLTDQQVYDYLSGSYDFKISELCYLADILDVKISDLMNSPKIKKDTSGYFLRATRYDDVKNISDKQEGASDIIINL